MSKAEAERQITVRCAPDSRIRRVRARVSMPLMPATPCSVSRAVAGARAQRRKVAGPGDLGIDHGDVGRLSLGEAGHDAIPQHQIPLEVEIAGGIDQPAASETQIHIAGTLE